MQNKTVAEKGGQMLQIVQAVCFVKFMNINLNLCDETIALCMFVCLFVLNLQGIYTTGAWEEKSDEISFADFKFSVTHHYLVQEPSDRDGKEEPAEGSLQFSFASELCHWHKDMTETI